MTTGAKPVLIAGAGLASLLFAQSLKRSGIPFHLYERDKDFSFRAQGYRLRLSSEGLDAIESVLPPETWSVFWDACGKTAGSGLVKLNAITGEEVKDGGGPKPSSDKPASTDKPATTGPPKMTLASRDGKVVGISRGDMRHIFMTGCESSIHYGHSVTGYELTPDGVRLVFADGSRSDEGSLLVGGEGIYSKTAKQLSKGKLKTYDTGVRGIHGQAPLSAFRGLQEGVYSIVDDSGEGHRVSVITNVRARRDDETEAETSALPPLGWTMVGEKGTVVPPNNDYAIVGKPAADIAKGLTKGWADRLRPLFEEMVVEDAAFWKITCSSPWGVPEWDNEARVTVIGDAVHSMTPAGGLGANTAVRDSALLGRLLAEAGGWTEGVTERYEKEMRVYGSEAVATSYGTAQMQFKVEIDENTPTV